MSLIEFAEELKNSLHANPTKENVEEIKRRINSATMNEKPLSKESIDFLYQYFLADGYDSKTESFLMMESNNEKFIDYVNYIFDKLGK